MNDILIILGIGALGYYIYTKFVPQQNSSVIQQNNSGFSLPVSQDFSIPSTGDLFSSLSDLFSSDTTSLSSDGNMTQQPSDVNLPAPATDFFGTFNSDFAQLFTVASSSGSNNALDIFKQNLIQEEGQSFVVYLDSKGIATVGIGHKVTASDRLKLGDTVSQSQIDAWFSNDTTVAYYAAVSQANDLRNNNPSFIAALADVNFQLGTGWASEFSTTYALLKTGNITQAIKNLYNSAWYSQTPNRVDKFANAIQNTFGTEV